MPPHDAPDVITVVIRHCHIVFQQPVGVHTVATGDDDTRRLLQCVQEVQNLLLCFGKPRFLMPLSPDVVLPVQKGHSGDLLRARPSTRSWRMIHSVQAKVHVLRSRQLHRPVRQLFHLSNSKGLAFSAGQSIAVGHLLRRNTLIQFREKFLCVHSILLFLRHAAVSYCSLYNSASRAIPSSILLNAVARETPSSL